MHYIHNIGFYTLAVLVIILFIMIIYFSYRVLNHVLCKESKTRDILLYLLCLGVFCFTMYDTAIGIKALSYPDFTLPQPVTYMGYRSTYIAYTSHQQGFYLIIRAIILQIAIVVFIPTYIWKTRLSKKL